MIEYITTPSGLVYAADDKVIINDFNAVAETICGIRLIIDKWEYKERIGYDFDETINILSAEGRLFPDHLSIYYLWPRNGSYAGYGSFPTDEKYYGILMFPLLGDNKYVLAHECGHTLGFLFHVFNEDFVDDTELVDKDDPNSNNLMSYGMATPQYLTTGQLERFYAMLRIYRKQWIMSD